MSHSAEKFRKRILLFLRKFLVSKSFMNEKEVSRFFVENFWSRSAEKFRGHPFNVSENLRYRKLLCIIGGITNFRLKFFVSQCRKTSWASLQCFGKFEVSKTVKDKLLNGNMLAPVFFSPNYKYFDQLLQTVKNKTTVLMIVFEEFLQTSVPPLISVLYAKGYHDFLLKNFRLTVPKNFIEEPVCVSEDFGYQKTLCLRGENHDFL